MAYNRTPQEHAFLKIERDLKAGEIPGLVLLCGREDYLTDHYANVLIRRYVEPASQQQYKPLGKIDLSSLGKKTETGSKKPETKDKKSV